MANDEKNRESLEIALSPLDLNTNGTNNTSASFDFTSPSCSIPLQSPKNYTDKAIRKLSIALRFLLHPHSPLNSNVTNLHDRYREFNPKFDVKYVNKIKKLVHSLWTSHPQDTEQMDSIHRFWDLWNNEFDPEDDDDTEEEDLKIDIRPLSAEISTVHSKFKPMEQDHMKRDYLDFMTQYNETHIDNPLLHHIEHDTSDPDARDKISELRSNIYSRKAMANWLHHWKQEKSTNYTKCLRIFKPFRWKKEVSYQLPMNEWDWQQVVCFIEDNESLKHFSSIFYEYHIDGRELCAMNFRHFEYLIEHALIQNQNVFETDFDKYKRIKKDIDKNWPLRQEIADLLKYIHRGRIQSHVISRYYLVYDILKRRKDHDDTAHVLYNIIHMLEPDSSSGPKQFWKMNAYFYCKLDNFLAVLIADEPIRKIYRKLYPMFVHDNEEQEDEEIKFDPSTPSKKRRTETLSRVVQTGWRNWRMKSVDPITGQSGFISDTETATPGLTPGTPARIGGIKDTDMDRYDTKMALTTRLLTNLDAQIHPYQKKKRYDCFDFVADAWCSKESRCNQYTHAISRVYFKVLAIFIFASLFGYLFVTLWYYNAAIVATDNAMKLTMEAIGEREVNYASYQLFQAQSLQHIALGEMRIYSDLLDATHVNDTTTRRAYVDDGRLDYLFVDWSSYPNTKHISSFLLYNNNTNTLIGGDKLDNNNTFVISVYNGSCVHQWMYDQRTRQRDINRPFGSVNCAFDPRDRPWYTELVESGGMNNSIWTKPYLFHNQVYGITLTTMIQHNDEVYILLNELTVPSVARFYEDDRLLLPEQTVLMLVTPSLSVLASSIGEIDLHQIEDCDACHAKNRMITTSMEFVRDNIVNIDANISASDIGYTERAVDQYWVNIFAFEALYMDSLLYGKPAQRGYIIIMYNEMHWDSIESTYVASWVICGLSLFVGILFIVYNIKFHRAAYFKRQDSGGYIPQSSRTTAVSLLGPDGTKGVVQTPDIANGATDDNTYAFQQSDDDDDDDDPMGMMIDPHVLKQTSIASVAGDDEDEQDGLLISPISAKDSADNEEDTGNESNMTPLFDTNDYRMGKPIEKTPTSQSKSILLLNKLIFEPRICQLTQQMLVIVLFIFTMLTFMLIIFLWSYTASHSIEGLIDDVMAPQEWNVVRDKVFQLIESAESAKHIIHNRLHALSGMENGMFNAPEFDQIFTNTMSSFVNRNNLYSQYFVYIGTPDGTFRGARVLTTNDTELLVSVRDITNNFTRHTHYTDSDNRIRNTDEAPYATNNIYDPRCRPWYLAAIKQRFRGTLHDAFPNGTWDAFSADDTTSLSRQTQACKNAVKEYNQTFSNASRITEYDSSAYLVWTTYAFVSLNAIGLTASAVITDNETNELIAVVGIDYTLNGLSQILNESIGTDLDKDSNWHSWIFNADLQDPYVIATSDFNVLTTTDSVEGCLQFAIDDNQMPYSVYTHPDLYIRIMSIEVLEHYGVDADVWVVNDSMPFELKAPIDYPVSQGGRISYYPDDSGLDWFIMKLVDVHTIKDSAGDALKSTATVVVLILVLSFICFKEISVQFENEYGDQNAANAQDDAEEDENQDYLKDMFAMQVIIEGAANRVWAQLCRQEEDHHLMTTDKAKDFLAERANQYIIGQNDRNQIFLHNVLQYTQQDESLLRFMKFMFSNYYTAPCQMVILCHILITFWEPPNPTALRTHGLSPNLIAANTICIILEFIFCIALNTLHRYRIFSIKREHLITIYELYYGKNHAWTKKIRGPPTRSATQLVMNGPHCARYLLRILIWSIICFDFLLRCVVRIGFFSYRIPPLPFLFIVEVRHVWDFCWEFASAIRYASDVVISYFAFIIIFAICAMSLFGSTDIARNELTVDAFDSITRSIVTAFVYISTSENYDAVVSETFFENDNVHPVIVVNALAVCLIFVVFGLFSFVPMIIHRFEESFNKTRIRKQEAAKYIKCEALIAAFIMLDMDGNLEIDRSEFAQLVTHSVLIDKNKLFDVFNADGDDVIDINEFVSSLCSQKFQSRMFYQGERPQNKFQAWMECNVYRRYRNRLMTFIALVLPVFGCALLRGLTDIDDETVDGIITAFFVLNAVDIALRYLSFGHSRFFDLARYPNPPYTTAAINKYNSKRNTSIGNKISEGDKVIRLSASDRAWVVKYLRDTRPRSILEKSVLSICHRLEWFAMSGCLIMFIVSSYVFAGNESYDIGKYHRHLFQLAIFMRFATLMRSNQKLLYVVFTVFPQFASLIIFLVLFIYWWARLGCTLFGDGDREIITENVYPESATMTTNFSTLGYSMLTLIQLMIGEGWHVVMYYNVMSTSLIFSSYFIFYIGCVTIIIANVFVGLFLADIDELKTKQDTDHGLVQFQKSSTKFKTYAKNKLKELHFEMQQIEDKRRSKLKQIETFNRLLLQLKQDKNKVQLTQSAMALLGHDQRKNETFALFD